MPLGSSQAHSLRQLSNQTEETDTSQISPAADSGGYGTQVSQITKVAISHVLLGTQTILVDI